jgi:hypothetical protein
MGKRSIDRNQPIQAYDQPADIAQPKKFSLLFAGDNIAAVFCDFSSLTFGWS